MTFYTDNRGSQRMDPTNIGDPLTFHLEGHLTCEISQDLLDRSAHTYAHSHGDPLTFSVVPQLEQQCRIDRKHFGDAVTFYLESSFNIIVPA